ncbi:MAG: succinyl-diaminopimelate desuccinylase [Rickettsiaceae bacterium H1]|nr:succinyl-diaminopimelate desuccinylase [Rickettsiaceae bacterium H1]
MKKLIDLCIDLVSRQSVTPVNDGAIEVIEFHLKKIGFITDKVIFDDTTNLYAKIGNDKPNLCFAGHTDVVPPGDFNKWKIPPFEPKVTNGKLYGRGVIDMKCAICAFIIATENYFNKGGKGMISLLITGDEEGSGKNGTSKLLELLKAKSEKIDACIIGEPTSNKKLGDTIKIGRRGSITFKLEVIGKQGHVAYPDLAINPIKQLVEILYKLQNHRFDSGNRFFQPSNCEVTTIDIGNSASNVIPEKATAQFNIRFNNLQTAEELEKFIRSSISLVTNDYTLEIITGAKPFITEPGTLSKIMINAINQTLDIIPEISTSGGTSDARHIKDFCPVIEFGLLNATAHQINEHATTRDIVNLSKIYECFLDLFFNS